MVAALVSAVALAVATISGLAWQLSSGNPTDQDLTSDVATQLVSQAASISNSDWEKIASSPDMPTPNSFDNLSLTLLFIYLRNHPTEQIDGRPDSHKDFRYENPLPKPVRIAQAIGMSRRKGYVSFIQPEYVTECTVQVEGNTAHGTVAFNVETLYWGRVDYVARRHQGRWVIDEFHLPNTGLSIHVDETGKWANMTRAIPGADAEHPHSKESP